VSEDMFHPMIFIKNKRVIEAHNTLNSEYKLGVNKFTALTHREFVEIVSNPREVPDRARV
jgi:hypothetical protein